jgi:ParB family transcriptional regulator, chromosome partitioning protein
MSRQALGRGLSALVREEVALQPGDSLREIDIDLIKPNSEQPRTRFAETALEELAQSIRENGVIQPILLRPDGDGFELIAGERRWRAAQRAELRKIPAVVREIADDKKLEIALIENIQRQELNPIEEAKAFKRLIEIFGLTQEKLAERIGKDRVLIANHLRLLKLPEDIQVLVEERKISAGHARAVLSIVELGEQRRLTREIIDRGLSVRETERIAKRINGLGNKGPATTATPKQTDANIKAAEVKLQRRLGTKVEIVPHGKNPGGKIEIEYYGDNDLHRIYTLLMQGEENAAG